MKKTILLLAFSTTALVQTACKKNSKSENRKEGLGKLIFAESSSMLTADFCSLTNSEPALHFGLERSPENNFYVFTQSQVNNGVSNFHNYFKYDSSGVIVNLDSSRHSLSTGELKQLYTVIESDTVVDYDPDSNYSALRITFGMEGRKIVLIYEPIVLKPTGVAKECYVVSTNKYFRTDSLENFIPLSYTLVNSLVNNLRGTSSNIHIAHPNNSGVYKFINNTDSTGDIRSNIVSFQQISKMYCDNNQETSSEGRINFSIVANRNETSTSNYRMHVVAHYGLGMSTAATGTYKNYAADYFQMCPTKCNIVSINFYD